MSKPKLIAMTQPIGLPEVDTAEELIAYCARVSNPDNQHNKLTAAKLLKYLAKHAHWSPFEMVHVVMDISATRDIVPQILRHGSFKFQEFSQRYAVAKNFTTDRECRMQDPDNRQNSIAEAPLGLKNDFKNSQEKVLSVALEEYDKAIAAGVAKECARALLPGGLTDTRLYMCGSLRSWIHYCALRVGNGTQKEHREIAETCWEEILKQFPTISEIIEQ